MSGRRSGLRKQVTGAKERPLQFRKPKGKGNTPGGKVEENARGEGIVPKWREGWVLHPKGF